MATKLIDRSHSWLADKAYIVGRIEELKAEVGA